ncbi:hypothetical protein OGAPHI_003503 [Ogataea philodendri]|uniref:SEC7 domain-containing protein n=1 Tax=Ogataea philodendri TaxID=1378263 RepID=A0A9P8P7Z4_9ASCO|nr:uncharacterized protein OGAPHI_003503 [Ogataea philodendri]KAH3666507.1 hypothetical protein OGAPHI_003503 [Ogataea philodendri]
MSEPVSEEPTTTAPPSDPADPPKETVEPESPVEPQQPVEQDVAQEHENGTTEPESVDEPQTIPLTNGSHASLPSSPARSRAISAATSVNQAATVSFIKSSFEKLLQIKEITKKHKNLVELLNKSIETLNTGELPTEHDLFEVLRTACDIPNPESKIVALDCLSKIFTFNVFSEPILISYKRTKAEIHTDVDIETNNDTNDGRVHTVPLIEAVVQVISSCFEGEGTDERVELQVIRVLTGAILNDSMPIHGKVLLQAVRQIYNIFLLSLSPVNQGIAQATLTQVVNVVFEKVSSARKKNNAELEPPEQAEDLAAPATPSTPIVPPPKMTLQEMEQNMQTDDVQIGIDEFSNEEELIVKDAFLILRSMCNLSVKVMENDSIDMRSHAIRSKLLSLHIVHWILKNHIDAFLDRDCNIVNRATNERTRLVDAIRKYLCLVLARNAASQLAPVYEVCLEIFWIMVDKMRAQFKSEIPVFLDEIYFPVSEMKSSTAHQKRYLLSIIFRICKTPKALIELYLNYDCDTSMPNLCELIMDYLARFALTRVEATPTQKVSYRESLTRNLATYNLSDVPQLNVAKLGGHPPNPDASLTFPVEYALKMTSIDCILAFLRSLNSWSGTPLITTTNGDVGGALSTYAHRDRALTSSSVLSQASAEASAASVSASETATSANDETSASQFENIKQRKNAFLDSVRLFNYNPKKGLKILLENGFIPSDSPLDIAKFLLETETLDKAAIGEFLGEGDEKNVAIMHEFVDLMEFKNKKFLDALRYFLQHFRLPGESQKIDRFMLKFAEKYVNDNPSSFANADTVYVLSYSVIMLNTDQHSPQVKKRMTLEDFVNNNRGIDDGKDIDHAVLQQIYTDIQNNEIILKSEQHAALIANDIQPIQQSFFGGRDLAKEQYAKASKEMSSKTEEAVKSIRNTSKKTSRVVFYPANVLNNSEHVRSMFDNLWMSILAGLTPPFKEYDDDDTSKLLLEGIKLSIHISCMFDLDYARTSFIRALVQFCNLNNPEELKDKNIDAVYSLLDVAVEENSNLGSSWKSILTSISQIERLKLLSQGVDSDTIPDLINARLASRNSIESSRSHNSNQGSFFPFGKKQTIAEQTSQHYFSQKLNASMILRISSTDLDVAIDKVFSKSSTIEGNGIFDFIAALSEVAHEEIESSGQSQNPRIFSLQKMVDVCYYNMGRIRVQWSALWAVMNEKFNEFGCHQNTSIAFFALDSLRQLSERFFAIEELSHFRFQKEFLKPFNYIILNSPHLQVREMVLDCVQYMIQKKADLIKSGWQTLLEILTNAAKDNNEKFVAKGLSYASMIMRSHFEQIIKLDAFSSLVVCLTEYAKNEQFQKSSLQSLQSMRKLVQTIPTTLQQHGDELTPDDLWFPLLFGFHDIVMNGEDLEVRSKALAFTFDALVENGGQFEGAFWDKVCEELLFPIFGILGDRWELNSTQDDLSVWLSTTLIQALRNMIALFGYYFDTLSGKLDGYLKLLVSCICQQNETISKIGISCLKELILDNLSKFSETQWNQINDSFAELFELTTAKELFKADPLKAKGEPKSDDSEDIEEEENTSVIQDGESDLELPLPLNHTKEKSAIVIKCVLQLHVIQILSELFDNDNFYQTIPVSNLLKLSDLLEHSYRFARDFNEDYNLRVRLWNAGVINMLPNLLKQETSSSGVYISILFRLYCDTERVNKEAREKIIGILIPIGVTILERYVSLNETDQSRNIQSWRPVVVEILQAYSELDGEDFIKCCPVAYDLVLQLFDKNMMADLRSAVKEFLTKVGDTYILEKQETNSV